MRTKGVEGEIVPFADWKETGTENKSSVGIKVFGVLGLYYSAFIFIAYVMTADEFSFAGLLHCPIGHLYCNLRRYYHKHIFSTCFFTFKWHKDKLPIFGKKKLFFKVTDAQDAQNS